MNFPFSSYVEIVEKIKSAKETHVDAMKKTIAATTKFINEKENFSQNNLKIYVEQFNKTLESEQISPSLSSALSFYLSKDANEPQFLESICFFLKTKFLPLLNEIMRLYSIYFDESYSKLSPFLLDLQNSQKEQNESNLIYEKTCKEIEELNKNHSSKRLEEKYNNACFEYQKIRQNLTDLMKKTDEKNKLFYAAVDKFLTDFERLDNDRHDQLQDLFSTFANAIEEELNNFNKFKEIVQEKSTLFDLIPKDIEEAYQNYSINSHTELPVIPESINLSFDCTQFLDIKKIFGIHLQHHFAHAKEQIIKGDNVVAEAGDRVIVRSTDEDIALISNLDDSIRLTVTKDKIEERNEFNRYLAIIKNGINKGHIVCVTAGGDPIEVINEYGLVEYIKSENIEKYDNPI